MVKVATSIKANLTFQSDGSLEVTLVYSLKLLLEVHVKVIDISSMMFTVMVVQENPTNNWLQ